MAGYKLFIKDDNGGDNIEIATDIPEGKGLISKVALKMKEIDHRTKSRADGVRAELCIRGNITEKNRELSKKLARWAMDENQKTIYRDVVLEVYNAENCSGEKLRLYELESMFVVDYKEEFGFKEDSVYKLYLAQKEGYNKREVYSN